MRQIFAIAFLTVLALKCYSQPKIVTGSLTYGPVPYRTLEQTIGEEYVVLPIKDAFKKHGYDALQKEGEPEYPKLKDTSLYGKYLKLIYIDEKGNAHLQALDGSKFSCEKINNHYPNIAPVMDINEAKKKFFQKTLWLNDHKIHPFNNKDDDYGSRFDPVKVIDVIPYTNSDCPIKFILQTAKGETGYLPIDVSGTNTDRDFIFEKYFFEQDPKTLYHFTPQEWHYIKAGLPQIGMSTEAVRLCIGPPNDINRTVTGKNVTEQYVYGFNTFSYYYFTNGKLTAIQH